MPRRLLQLTPRSPGAIAIIQVMDDDAAGLDELLFALTGHPSWPTGKMRVAKLADIDEGLVARLSETSVQLMPHGGPRVVQRLVAWLIERGAEVVGSDEPSATRELFPEAADVREAAMLQRASLAASPLAIDLLLDQPRRWRTFMNAGQTVAPADLERSKRLNRLIHPPIVVLAGLPNVGKSTLSNTLLGRSMSITMDQPGTTRDYTAGLIDLAGLVVHWHDTPGLRETHDPIEAKAIEVARKLIAHTNLLIVIRDSASDWPMVPRQPDLWVLSKIDSQIDPRQRQGAGATPEHPVCISVKTGFGLPELVLAVRDRLVPPDDLQDASPWLLPDPNENV